MKGKEINIKSSCLNIHVDCHIIIVYGHTEQWTAFEADIDKK